MKRGSIVLLVVGLLVLIIIVAIWVQADSIRIG